ncbi:hypothetical protein RI367_004938 [Sorochytrium milnesiophthora]
MSVTFALPPTLNALPSLDKPTAGLVSLPPPQPPPSTIHSCKRSLQTPCHLELDPLDAQENFDPDQQCYAGNALFSLYKRQRTDSSDDDAASPSRRKAIGYYTTQHLRLVPSRLVRTLSNGSITTEHLQPPPATAAEPVQQQRQGQPLRSRPLSSLVNCAESKENTPPLRRTQSTSSLSSTDAVRRLENAAAAHTHLAPVLARKSSFTAKYSRKSFQRL